MQLNYLAILVCSLLSLALGFLWYGPLFGKIWMEISGMNTLDEVRKSEMQKNAWKLYSTQIIMSFFQIFIIDYYLVVLEKAGGIQNVFWFWLAFIVPTVAGSVMWGSDSKKVSWQKFLIQAGYQLVLFLMFGFILGFWK